MDRYKFIWKAIQKHGYKYDYRKVNYINSKTKVCIICPEHGEFWQRPNDHLMKKGCAKCGIKKSILKQRANIHEFLSKAIQKHDNKYDYSKVKYKGNKNKICIICPEHGEFWQRPNGHLNGQGCPKCIDNIKLTNKTFIEKVKKIHGDKYDYSKVNYINSKTKVCIICPKHGEFWQRPAKHLYGRGCFQCANEKNISELILKEKMQNIFKNVEYQKRFQWLGRQTLDFYLPDYNIAIEYQGRQHFKNIYDKIDEFYKTCKRDENKYNKCLVNNIKLIYFTYDNRDIPSKYFSYIFTNEDDLINYIKEQI